MVPFTRRTPSWKASPLFFSRTPLPRLASIAGTLMPHCPFLEGTPRSPVPQSGHAAPRMPHQCTPPGSTAPSMQIYANMRNARKSMKAPGAVSAGRPAPERRCRPRYKAAAARPSRSAELRQPGDRQVVRQRRHHGECQPRLLSPSGPASAPWSGLGSP